MQQRNPQASEKYKIYIQIDYLWTENFKHWNFSKDDPKTHDFFPHDFTKDLHSFHWKFHKPQVTKFVFIVVWIKGKKWRFEFQMKIDFKNILCYQNSIVFVVHLVHYSLSKLGSKLIMFVNFIGNSVKNWTNVNLLVGTVQNHKYEARRRRGQRGAQCPQTSLRSFNFSQNCR